ncbi:MAG TPA: hypothetical protein VK188_06250 [Holophaga sp.]|nr:hypothetical protein [Holophaga sp.]
MAEASAPVSSEQPKSNPEFGVVLPCAPSDFTKFISGLLGKPQTIEKILFGHYVIKKEDILSIFHLIDQRINQQNEANFVQATVRIMYDDDSSVLLNSIDDFTNYSEIRPLLSIGIVLSATYLIKFKDKTYHEKQSIDISFMTDVTDANILIPDDGIHVLRRMKHFGGNFISFRISHTARTWGADIEALLTGHIKDMFIHESKLKRMIWSHSEIISLSTAILLFAGMLLGSFFAATRFMANQIENSKSIINLTPQNTEALSIKVNGLIDMLAQGAWSRFMIGFSIYFVASIIICIFVGILVETTSSNAPRCHILLTKKAHDYFKLASDKRKRKWVYFCLTIVLNVIIGFVSNFIFSWVFNKSIGSPSPQANITQ